MMNLRSNGAIDATEWLKQRNINKLSNLSLLYIKMAIYHENI